jgi:alkanesulfonate monooxygenase SsuD/methylene tetrahydromethanopterin reductase-like flavin-dependent oxidoreductase (luciferase family)
VKKIGFLSFGHWTPSPQSATQSAADALLQSIDLAVEAERLGMDGAYFRVHHFARQLASPFPLLAAVGAKTRKIEIGTAVIDMRYENPHYMAEDAGAADLIAGGRLQLGISRGSPEQVIDGWRHFGYQPAEGENDEDIGRRHAQEFLELLRGKGFAKPNPRPMFPNPPGLLRLEPYSEGLRDRIWWGAASNATAAWAAKLGMNLQSSTLKFDETGEPFHVQQAAQIRIFRAAWKEAGHTRTPRVSVSRSIFALIDDRDRAYFGRGGQEADKIGFLEESRQAIFGRSYAAEPDVLIGQLRKDDAITEADTLLLTVPNQLGVAYNAHAMEAILTTVAQGSTGAKSASPRLTRQSEKCIPVLKLPVIRLIGRWSVLLCLFDPVSRFLQALAMNEGNRRKKKLWSVQGRSQLEKLPLGTWASRRRHPAPRRREFEEIIMVEV